MYAVQKTANCVNSSIGLTNFQRHQAMLAKAASVLTFLRAYIAEHGTSPYFREIAAHLGLNTSKSTVARLLDLLEQQGCIRRLRFHHCAIEVLPHDQWFRFDDTTKTLVEYRP